jgi:hypothetical protein
LPTKKTGFGQARWVDKTLVNLGLDSDSNGSDDY